MAKSKQPQGLFADSSVIKQGQAGGVCFKGNLRLSTTRKTHDIGQLRRYLKVTFCSKGVES